MIALYITVCILWGFYCARQNYHRHKSGFWKQFLGFIANVIGCPITLALAIFYDEIHKPINTQ